MDEENKVNKNAEESDVEMEQEEKSNKDDAKLKEDIIENDEKSYQSKEVELSTNDGNESDNITSLSTSTKEYDIENENSKKQADIEGVLTDEIPEPKYKDSDKIYARDGSKLLYKAHVRRSMYGPVKQLLDENGNEQEERDAWHYFVHFHKWGSRWDSWIVEDDIFPNNKLISDLAILLAKAVRGVKGSKKIGEKIEKTEKEFWEERKPQDDEEDIKRLHEEHVKQEKEKETTRLKKLKEKSMCTPLPQSLAEKISLTVPLKKIMVDEWEAITQLNLSGDIPAKVTVQSVLDKYLDHKLDLISDTSEQEEWKIAMHELSLYFNKALPFILYPQEIAFSNAIKLYPCKIYSCEYLLRLLVKLPALIKEECKPFCLKMSDLVRYLNKNQFAFFQQVYNKNDDNVAIATIISKMSDTTEGKRKFVKRKGTGRKKLKIAEQQKITDYLNTMAKEEK